MLDNGKKVFRCATIYNGFGVKPGCQMYMFESSAYKGGNSYVTSGVVYDNPYWTQNSQFAPGPQSYVCTCKQELPDCQASDGWETVIICDNSRNSATADCSYNYDVGTTFSNSITESNSVSLTISGDIGVALE